MNVEAPARRKCRAGLWGMVTGSGLTGICTAVARDLRSSLFACGPSPAIPFYELIVMYRVDVKGLQSGCTLQVGMVSR